MTIYLNLSSHRVFFKKLILKVTIKLIAFSESCYAILNSSKNLPILNLIDAKILFCHPVQRTPTESRVEGQKRLEQKAGRTLKRSTAIAFQNKMKVA